MTQNEIVLEKPNVPTTPFRTNISRPLVAKSVVSNWSFLLVNVLVAFWMTPFVVRRLGDIAYGIWALVLQLTGYMGVIDVGVRSALVRFVARLRAQKDHAGLNRLLSSTLMVYGLLAPVCIVIGFLLSAYVLPHMHIGATSLRMAQITVVVASGLVACDFLFATSHATLAGLSRWDLINATWIPMVLIRTALIVLFLELGYGLITVALIQLATYVMGYLVEILLICVHHLVPEFQFMWHKPDRRALRPVVEHSWYSLLLSLANRINYQVDTIVIGAFLPIGQVTFYIIGLRLIEYLRDLLNSSTMIVAPLVSSFEAVGDSRGLNAMLLRGTRYSVLIGYFAGAAFLILGRDFIRLWMGPRFESLSGSVLIILTLGVIVSCTQFASGHILFGLSKHRINLGWTMVESVLNLAFSIAFVHRYGILGVAAGTAIANLVVRGWFYPHSVLKALDVSWGMYLKAGVLPAIVPALTFIIGVWSYRRFFPIQTYPGLFMASVCGFSLFVITAWYVTLDEADRKFAISKSFKLLSQS